MATIRIKVSDNILDQVLLLLEQFKVEDLEIMDHGSVFEANKKYLHHELARLESGEAKTYSIKEADEFLEQIIRKNEG